MRLAPIIACLFIAVLVSSCDTVEPVGGDVLVLEAYFEADETPTVTIRRTAPLDQAISEVALARVADAQVRLTLEDTTVAFQHTSTQGRYSPASAFVLEAGDVFGLHVTWRDQSAFASGRIPPPISIEDVRLVWEDRPVEAVFLDSLRLDTLGVAFDEGFIHPVEVSVRWPKASGVFPEDLWVQAELRTFASFGSAVLDFFLLSKDVVRESSPTVDGSFTWTGVYAVPAEQEADPIADHDVQIVVVRGGEEFALFASSGGAPESREPTSNVEGAIGIVTGVAVDSLRVRIRDGVVQRSSSNERG